MIRSSALSPSRPSSDSESFPPCTTNMHQMTDNHQKTHPLSSMFIPAFTKLSYHLIPVILISRLRYPPHRRFPTGGSSALLCHRITHHPTLAVSPRHRCTSPYPSSSHYQMMTGQPLRLAPSLIPMWAYSVLCRMGLAHLVASALTTTISLPSFLI